MRKRSPSKRPLTLRPLVVTFSRMMPGGSCMASSVSWSTSSTCRWLPRRPWEHPAKPKSGIASAACNSSMGSLRLGARNTLATEGRGLVSCRKGPTGTAANVRAIVHAVKANLRNGSVGFGECTGKVGAIGGDSEDPAAARKV